jgi:hypothetical protein
MLPLNKGDEGFDLTRSMGFLFEEENPSKTSAIINQA